MVPFSSIRGRPKSAIPKQRVSVRYSPEVIECFRATGAGWQSRMDVQQRPVLVVGGRTFDHRQLRDGGVSEPGELIARQGEFLVLHHEPEAVTRYLGEFYLHRITSAAA